MAKEPAAGTKAPSAPPVRRDECFLICPIGPEGSDVRARSDDLRDHLFRPAIAKLKLTLVRGDEINELGQITTQLLDRIITSKVGWPSCVSTMCAGNFTPP